MESTAQKGLRAKEGRTELYAEHEGKDITFIYPAKGPGTFAQVGEQIDSDGLIRPTMAQTASLAYAAWQNPKDKYSSEVIDVIKNKWLWAFNGILYVPNKGAYIQDDPKTENGRVSMNLSELEKMLKEGDPRVRFVPFGYKTEKQTALELGKNRFVQALAEKEGAEKLAEVANRYKKQPYVWSFNNVNEETQRVAALGSLWVLGGWLGVDGDGVGGYGGRAFGVQKTAPKALRKK